MSYFNGRINLETPRFIEIPDYYTDTVSTVSSHSSDNQGRFNQFEDLKSVAVKSSKRQALDQNLSKNTQSKRIELDGAASSLENTHAAFLDDIAHDTGPELILNKKANANVLLTAPR